MRLTCCSLLCALPGGESAESKKERGEMERQGKAWDQLKTFSWEEVGVAGWYNVKGCASLWAENGVRLRRGRCEAATGR